MGEAKRKRLTGEQALMSSASLHTAGGKVQVRWACDSAATPMGQLAYFIEFLTLTGLWSRWQEGCPLAYTRPNASSKAAVLGAWQLLRTTPRSQGIRRTVITLTGLHAHFEKAKQALTRVSG